MGRIVCWWLGVVFLLASLGSSIVVVAPHPGSDESLGFTTIVVGSWVPTTGSVFLITLALAIALFLVARALSRAPRRPPAVRAVRTALLVILLATAVPAGALVALAGSSFQMLPGSSAGGCRIVVQEYTFLYAASGNAGIVQPGSATVEWAHGAVEGYTADDGYMPFTAGTYRLTWEGPEAGLNIWGSGSSPVHWASGSDPGLLCNR